MALNPMFLEDWGIQEKEKPKNKVIPIINTEVDKHSKLISQFYKLYILKRDKYLLLFSNGNYIAKQYNKDNKNDDTKPLLDWMIVSHLKGKKTVGTYAGLNATKFICFDIDTKELAGKYYYKLVNYLISIGISKEFIYPSFSGTKGYHVEIFFNNPMSVSDLQKLYNKILLDIDATKTEIEFRPTYGQGVKIPLGRNFKSQDMDNNICWYVDVDTLEPIKDVNYMMKIQKIDSKIITNIIKEIIPVKIKEKKDINYINTKENKVTSLPVFTGNEYNINNLENLLNDGITQQGTRHKSMIKLARYFKHLGKTKEKSIIELMEWLERQPKHTYSSTVEEIKIDINKIIDWVYDNNKGIINKRNTIEFYKEEIDYILQAENKNEKILLFYMMIHSKRYSDNEGKFYMTYNQMVELSGLDNKTVRRLVNNLENSNLLNIIARNEKQENTYIKKPNVYSINNIEIISSNIYNINLDSDFCDCLFYFYNEKELRKILKRRQFEYFISTIKNK